MLPCSRTCAGKKLNPWSTFHSEHNPVEPLLFLYPTACRSAIQHLRNSTATQTRVFSCKTKHRSPATAAAEVGYNDGHPSPDDGPGATHPTHPSRQYRFVPSKLRSRISKIQTSPKMTYSFTNKRRKVVARQIITKVESKEKLIINYNPARIDGLHLAKKLASMPASVSNTDQDQEVLWADSTFLQWLIGTSEENIWKHTDGSGCTFHAYPASLHMSSKRRVVLLGSPRAREIAVHHLKSMKAVYQKESTNVTDQQSQESSGPEEFWKRLSVDQYPRPRIWTLRSFYEYVKRITELKQPKSIERMLYPEHDSYHKRVARILTEIFSDPELQPFLSSIALRQALDFTSSRTELSATAHKIWHEYRQANLTPDIECYNAEIKRCLRYGNGAHITSLVRDMVDTRVRPNATTWAIFFELLRDNLEQRKFLNMLVHGKIAPNMESQQIIIQALTLREFKPHDQDRSCVSAFDQRMRRTFGDTWLTSLAAETMIERSVRAGAYQTISSVMELAHAASVGINNAAMDAISHAVAQTDDFTDTITLLEMQQSDPDVCRRQEGIDNAFRQAWRLRCANTCKVIWYYAASHGFITHDMVRCVAKYLTYNVHPATGQQRRDESFMAAIVIDAAVSKLGTSDESDLFEAFNTNLEVLDALTRWESSGERRNKQMRLAHHVMERQLTAWQRFCPMQFGTFLDLLHKAQKMDREWSEKRAIPKLILPTLVQESIVIDLTSLLANRTSQAPSATTITGNVVGQETQISAPPSTTLGERGKQHSQAQIPIEPTSIGKKISTEQSVEKRIHDHRPVFHTRSALSDGDTTSTTLGPSALHLSSVSATTSLRPCSRSVVDVLARNLRLPWKNDS